MDKVAPKYGWEIANTETRRLYVMGRMLHPERNSLIEEMVSRPARVRLDGGKNLGKRFLVQKPVL